MAAAGASRSIAAMFIDTLLQTLLALLADALAVPAALLQACAQVLDTLFRLAASLSSLVHLVLDWIPPH